MAAKSGGGGERALMGKCRAMDGWMPLISSRRTLFFYVDSILSLFLLRSFDLCSPLQRIIMMFEHLTAVRYFEVTLNPGLSFSRGDGECSSLAWALNEAYCFHQGGQYDQELGESHELGLLVM